MSGNIGILGIGVFLPEQVRKNDWWPEHLVKEWRARAARRHESTVEADWSARFPGARLVLAAMEESADDPYMGAVERRVAPDMLESEMELRAARDAIERSGIDPQEIGILLGYSIIPDYLTNQNACILHDKLGLRRDCFTLTVDAVCNSFQMQLVVAEKMLRGGMGKYALLVQSSTLGRLVPISEPHSPTIGEGATAVVLGPVADGYGLLAHADRTDGTLYRGMVTGIRGKRWFAGSEPLTWFQLERDVQREMIMRLPDNGKEVVDEALAKANVRKEDVSFYASHQALVWFRKVTQEYIGLGHARTVDIFPWTGSLTACNIPLVLACGVRDGLLRDGDYVATYSGGSGITFSGNVIRWGGITAA